MHEIILTKKAQKQLEIVKINKKLLKKVLEVIDNIESDPYSPKFKFERLKHDLAGFCSKRIDKQNRIVYQVRDREIIIIVISILGHYS